MQYVTLCAVRASESSSSQDTIVNSDDIRPQEMKNPPPHRREAKSKFRRNKIKVHSRILYNA